MRADGIVERPKEAPRPLSKHEIDRRIQGAIAEVFEDEAASGRPPLAPRWISAAELVRRVSPFLSRN